MTNLTLIASSPQLVSRQTIQAMQAWCMVAQQTHRHLQALQMQCHTLQAQVSDVIQQVNHLDTQLQPTANTVDEKQSVATNSDVQLLTAIPQPRDPMDFLKTVQATPVDLADPTVQLSRKALELSQQLQAQSLELLEVANHGVRQFQNL